MTSPTCGRFVTGRPAVAADRRECGGDPPMRSPVWLLPGREPVEQSCGVNLSPSQTGTTRRQHHARNDADQDVRRERACSRRGCSRRNHRDPLISPRAATASTGELDKSVKAGGQTDPAFAFLSRDAALPRRLPAVTTDAFADAEVVARDDRVAAGAARAAGLAADESAEQAIHHRGTFRRGQLNVAATPGGSATSSAESLRPINDE